MEKLTKNSFPGILCGIVILFLTGLPGSAFPHVKPVIGLDKAVHVCMYATFAFLCIWGYRQQFVAGSQSYRRKALLTATLVSIAYGGLTELMQEFLVPSRTGDWFDFLADGMGTIVGTTAFLLFFGKKK